MAITFKGNFKKAIGFHDIVIDGVTIQISELRPEWVKKFTDIMFDQKLDEKGKIELFSEYFTEFFKNENRDESVTDEEISLFVRLNITKLIEEFTILFKLTDKETLELKKKEELLKLKSKNPSPSE